MSWYNLSLAGFLHSLIRLLFGLAFVIASYDSAVGQTFSFPSGLEAWYRSEVYDDLGAGPFSSNFSALTWNPSTPMYAYFSTSNGHGVRGSSGTYWTMKVMSPDLSANASWQKAVGYSAKFYHGFGSAPLWVNLYVAVYDYDQLKVRYFYSGTAQSLSSGGWTTLSFNWGQITTFPTNYQIRGIYAIYWGLLAQYYSGSAGIDEVVPVIDTTPPSIAITAPTSSPTYTTSTSSVNLGGTSSDGTRVALVTWASNRGGSGTATGTSNWTASGILLQLGSNVLTVTARDAAQNTSVDSITVSYVPPPVITVSTTALSDFGSIRVGSSSTSKQYTVSGSNLTTDITVTAPSGFQVSLNNSTFGNSVSLLQSLGTVPTTTVYARFSPVIAGTQSWNIAHSASGSTTMNVSVSGTGVISVITVSTTALSDFGSIQVESNSASQQYAVSGSTLASDITVMAPSGFQVSLNNTTFGGSVTLVQSLGVVPTATVYARFSPTAGGLQSGSVLHTSSGAVTKNVSVSGTGAVPTPVITVSKAELADFGSIQVGNSSASKQYTVSGSDLTEDITVTPSSWFQVSLDNSTFSSVVTLVQSRGAVPTTTVYVRCHPTSVGTQSGSIVHKSAGAVTANVSVSGTGIVPTPVMTVSKAELSDFGSIQLGNSSTPQQYTVSGSNLTADITLTAPPGFQVSLNNTAFSISVALLQSLGTVPTATVYARFTPTAAGTQSGLIAHTSPGAVTKTVSVRGATTTSVEELSTDSPSSFRLRQNYPNPFNPRTSISYSLPKTEHVSLRIHNTFGQAIAWLVNQEKSAGIYNVEWDAMDVPSGIYFYRLQAGEFVETKKMILLR